MVRWPLFENVEEVRVEVAKLELLLHVVPIHARAGQRLASYATAVSPHRAHLVIGVSVCSVNVADTKEGTTSTPIRGSAGKGHQAS